MTNRRKAGMTSSHHGPYGQGYTRATMGRTEGSEAVRRSGAHKASHSSDWSLQPDSMKAESLVIANQNVAVNTFRALYTPPVTPWEWIAPEVACLTFLEGGYHGVVYDWGEVVTR